MSAVSQVSLSGVRPTALLVGGSGGTGSLVAAGLRDRGYAVTILHRGIHEPEEIADFPHIHADPHFTDTIEAAIGACTFDLVVLAYGRLELLSHVFAGRCGRLIAIGGVPIYGGYLEPDSCWPTDMPVLASELAPVAAPERMKRDGAAKFARKMVAAQEAVMQHHAAGSYAATIIRYPQVYGPNAIGGVEETIIDRLRDGRKIVLLPYDGLGVNTRCATRNAAHTVLLAVDCPVAEGRIFNCSDEDRFTLRQWVQLILEAAGSQAEMIGLPPSLTWAGADLLPLGGTTTTHSLVDTSAARTILGYRDVIPAREALRRTVEWRLAHPRRSEPRTDYRLEDDIIERLRRFDAECAELRHDVPIVHPYPHPRSPGNGIDHRGR